MVGKSAWKKKTKLTNLKPFCSLAQNKMNITCKCCFLTYEGVLMTWADFTEQNMRVSQSHCHTAPGADRRI